MERSLLLPRESGIGLPLDGENDRADPEAASFAEDEERKTSPSPAMTPRDEGKESGEDSITSCRLFRV